MVVRKQAITKAKEDTVRERRTYCFSGWNVWPRAEGEGWYLFEHDAEGNVIGESECQKFQTLKQARKWIPKHLRSVSGLHGLQERLLFHKERWSRQS